MADEQEQRDILVRQLMRSFDGSRSAESKRNGMSLCDIIAARYIRQAYEEQKRAANRDIGVAFEG